MSEYKSDMRGDAVGYACPNCQEKQVTYYAIHEPLGMYVFVYKCSACKHQWRFFEIPEAETQ